MSATSSATSACVPPNCRNTVSPLSRVAWSTSPSWCLITSQNIVPHLVEAFRQTYGEPLTTLSFDTLTALPEVKSLADDFASEEWKYGRWKHFSAQRSAQFEWGGVDLAVEVDESSARITHIDIATDSLDTTLVPLVRQLLTGASSQTPPAIPADTVPAQAAALRDILSLLY